ncbi:type IX secretion system membrane protein PorP/SprF [Paracrocinitomix mangrovi]|uniref:PorP/SprF family type IX secretion system membrane protein n=1 Tax=Paracrocinitomix mangrovi TaxID=2862509 RepID=UPI001C8D719B|nr:type IX secretion system membrane protein PorP/SprF [Paracrocinitomix mangrovi]UKN00523.1 type IX secretion system membrane protein PorP/SprF [Paracrocinitomix mangrovi]
MKKLVVLISILAFSKGFAQQLEHYTQYQFNQFAFNPAIAGTKNCLDIRTGYRFQWVGIDGAPQTGFINAHAPLRSSKRKRNAFGPKHGIGGQIKRDVFGPFSNLKLHATYALHLPITRNWNLSFGASIGFMHSAYKISDLTTEVADPSIGGTSQSFIVFPDAIAGMWLSDKKTYVGLSVHNLIGNRLDEIGQEAKLQRHVYLTGGRKFALEKKWSIIPSFFLMWTKASPIDFHLSALVDLDNKLTFGVGLRRTDAITTQIRVKLFNWISIGYSFDFVISKLSGNMWYTHEITGGFNSCSSYGNNSTTSCPSFE